MANLKNCIITAHISQEFELDQAEGIPNVSDWNSTNPGLTLLQHGGIANMSHEDNLFYDENDVAIYSGANVTEGEDGNSCPGGCSSIILVIQPNNSPENLEGKTYQYVVAASSFKVASSIKGFHSQIAKNNTALVLDPDYSPQNDVDYVVAYGADGQIDVKRTQTGIYFQHKCNKSRFVTDDQIDPNWEGVAPIPSILTFPGSTSWSEDHGGVFTSSNINFFPHPASISSGDKDPYDVEYVTFHDTGIPNTPGNKVIVKIYLRSDFVMPGNNYNVKVDIRMDAVPYFPPHPNKLKWILTNQIWPNYNSWKLLTGNRIQDTYRYQYWDETVTNHIDFTWMGSTSVSDINDLANLYVGYTGNTFSINFEEVCQYYESIGYYPKNYYYNATTNNGWLTTWMNSDTGVPDGIWTDLMNDYGATMWSFYNAVAHGNIFQESAAYLHSGQNTDMNWSFYEGGDDGGWTPSGYNDWLTHEFIGRQNPRAIKNCTIKHINGTPTYDYSIDQYTWTKEISLNQTISDIVGTDEVIEYKITPDEGYTLSAFDVCILPKMNLEYNGTTGVYELPVNTVQDVIYGGYIGVQNSGITDRFDPDLNNINESGGEINYHNINSSYFGSDDEDIESIMVKLDYNRPHTPTDKISLNKHFKDFIDTGSSVVANLSGEYFINVKWEDGTTLPYDTGTQMYADTLDKIMFGSDASLMSFTEEEWEQFFNGGDALPQDVSQFEPNQYFNKKFESWKFGYPLVFSPFKIVNLGNISYEHPWVNTDGDVIQKPYGFEISGDERDDYPGGARSFGGYNDNSGIQYVEIKNTIPHSFQENPSPDNEVIVRIKIKSDWMPDESALSSEQVYMLNIWGQARSESEELEFNVGPN